MALTSNAIFLRQTHIGILLPSFPLLIVTGILSSPLPACLLIPLSISGIFAAFLLYRNKKGRKVNVKAQLLMDAVLASTYLGLLMPLWIGIAPRRWSYYNDEAFTKLETYSCAFAMISMTIQFWFTLSGLYSVLPTLRIRGLLSRECPSCRAREIENEEVRGLLEHSEPNLQTSPVAPTVTMKNGARYMLVDTDATPRSSEDIQRSFLGGEA